MARYFTLLSSNLGWSSNEIWRSGVKPCSRRYSHTFISILESNTIPSTVRSLFFEMLNLLRFFSSWGYFEGVPLGSIPMASGTFTAMPARARSSGRIPISLGPNELGSDESTVGQNADVVSAMAIRAHPIARHGDSDLKKLQLVLLQQ